MARPVRSGRHTSQDEPAGVGAGDPEPAEGTNRPEPGDTRAVTCFDCGLSAYEAETYLRPLRVRLEHRTTPAGWKRDRVRERLDDGTDLAEAVHGMQRDYVRRQARTLLEGTFADWLRT
jgi:hypothetical protein